MELNETMTSDVTMQEEVTEIPEELFEEETTETNEEPEVEETEETPAEEFIDFKYLKEVKKLPAGAVKEVAAALGYSDPSQFVNVLQIGHNVPRQLEQMDKYKGAFKVVEDLSKVTGSDIPASIERLNQLVNSARVKQEENAVRAEQPDIKDPLAVEKLAAERVRYQDLQIQQQASMQQEVEKKARETSFTNLFTSYPAALEMFNKQSLPEQILDYDQYGFNDAVSAFLHWENSRLKADMETAKKTEKVQNKTVGGVTGDGSQQKSDLFLEGLFSD